MATHAAPDRRAVDEGRGRCAEAWLEEVASEFGAPSPEAPEPLRGLATSRFGTSAPPEGWPRDQFDAFAKILRTAMAQYPDGPPEGWLPYPD